MSYTIRWGAPLNSRERRWLRCWLDRVANGRPGIVRRRPGAITVHGATAELAHSFAALTMAVLGRPAFAYTLAAGAERRETWPAAA